MPKGTHIFIDGRYQRKIESWRLDYKDFGPHSSLNNMTPNEYATISITENSSDWKIRLLREVQFKRTPYLYTSSDKFSL